ncbi:MAG: hypothetical protein ACFWUK_00470 [Serratia liquefaciens]
MLLKRSEDNHLNMINCYVSTSYQVGLYWPRAVALINLKKST